MWPGGRRLVGRGRTGAEGVALVRLRTRRLPGSTEVVVGGGRLLGRRFGGRMVSRVHLRPGRPVFVSPLSSLIGSLRSDHPKMSRKVATRRVRRGLALPSFFGLFDLNNGVVIANQGLEGKPSPGTFINQFPNWTNELVYHQAWLAGFLEIMNGTANAQVQAVGGPEPSGSARPLHPRAGGERLLLLDPVRQRLPETARPQRRNPALTPTRSRKFRVTARRTPSTSALTPGAKGSRARPGDPIRRPSSPRLRRRRRTSDHRRGPRRHRARRPAGRR